MPQGFLERQDYGTRFGVEKAIKPDEALARAQVNPGLNIYFTYAGGENEDIYINALTSVSASNQRQLHTIIVPQVRPSGGTGQRWISGGGLISIEDVGYNTAAAADVGEDRYKYGTVYYADIAHNWNLSGNNRFLFSIRDARFLDGVTPQHLEIFSNPRIIGYDANTVRVCITRSRTAIAFGGRVPRYEFSLMEIL